MSSVITRVVVVMVGLPGSGKSTAAKQYVHRGYRLVSTDQIRQRYGFEYYQPVEKEIWRIAIAELRIYLKRGSSVVFDATNVTPERRRLLIRQAVSCAATPIACLVDTPLDECLKRNRRRQRRVPEEAIRSLASRYVKPTLAEGFARVIETTAAARL